MAGAGSLCDAAGWFGFFVRTYGQTVSTARSLVSRTPAGRPNGSSFFLVEASQFRRSSDRDHLNRKRGTTTTATTTTTITTTQSSVFALIVISSIELQAHFPLLDH